MKRILIIAITLLCTGFAMAERTGIHASDARLTYVGRTHIDSTMVSMDWTGCYVRVHFIGKRLSVRVSDTGKNFYNLYVDRDWSAEPDQVVTITGDTILVLYEGKKAKEHTLMLYKRTEGEQGKTTFHEFFIDGELLEAEPLRERQIEFIGDSYTCGYGVENSLPTDNFTPQTETSAKTFAAIVARYFGADMTLIAHSGMGIVRNYNSKFNGWYMPDRYEQTFDVDSTLRWDAKVSNWHPQITVILLGGNDFSVGKQPAYEDFATNYLRLLNQIKINYGATHPILCCVKKGNDGLLDYVRGVVKDCGLENVNFCPFFPVVFSDDERNLGADHHPNYEGHKKAAHVLLPYISTLTDWPLINTPIE